MKDKKVDVYSKPDARQWYRRSMGAENINEGSENINRGVLAPGQDKSNVLRGNTSIKAVYMGCSSKQTVWQLELQVTGEY